MRIEQIDMDNAADQYLTGNYCTEASPYNTTVPYNADMVADQTGFDILNWSNFNVYYEGATNIPNIAYWMPLNQDWWDNRNNKPNFTYIGMWKIIDEVEWKHGGLTPAVDAFNGWTFNSRRPVNNDWRDVNYNPVFRKNSAFDPTTAIDIIGENNLPWVLNPNLNVPGFAPREDRFIVNPNIDAHFDVNKNPAWSPHYNGTHSISEIQNCIGPTTFQIWNRYDYNTATPTNNIADAKAFPTHFELERLSFGLDKAENANYHFMVNDYNNQDMDYIAYRIGDCFNKRLAEFTDQFDGKTYDNEKPTVEVVFDEKTSKFIVYYRIRAIIRWAGRASAGQGLGALGADSRSASYFFMNIKLLQNPYLWLNWKVARPGPSLSIVPTTVWDANTGTSTLTWQFPFVVNRPASTYVCASFSLWEPHQRIGVLQEEHDELNKEYPYNQTTDEFEIWFCTESGQRVDNPDLEGAITLDLHCEGNTVSNVW
jgi:hypothetical protein